MHKHIAILAALLLPATAFAGGYAVPNMNARDEGMAGSAVANQTGPEAAFGNSAMLAGQKGLGISASLGAINFRSTWRDTTGAVGNGSSVDTTPKLAFPPALTVAYGDKYMDRAYGLGFTFNVPGGGLVYWPTSWPGAAAVYKVDRRVYSLELAGGVQLLPQLKLGLSGVYFRTTEALAQAIDVLPAPGQSNGSAELGTAGGAFSYTASLLAQPIADVPLRIGVQYRHKADMTLTGDAHFGNIPASLVGADPSPVDQHATHKLSFPNVLNAGVSYDLPIDLTLNAAVTFFRFTVYKTDRFEGDKGFVVEVPRNYHNSMTYRLGGEYGGITKGLKIRAGVLRDMTPQPTDTLDPSLPDSDRWAISAGAGYDITDALTVNASTEFAIFDKTSVTGTHEFPGTYDTRANLFSVGVTYRMK